MRKLQASQIFLCLSGLGALIAVAGIVLLFTQLTTLGPVAIPIGIVMCVGCLIGTAITDNNEQNRAFADAHVSDARIVDVVGTGGTASNGGRLEQLHFDVHVELPGASGVPVKRIVGVVCDAGFAHTHLNKGQTLRIRHHTTDPDDIFDARYDATGQAVADLKRRG